MKKIIFAFLPWLFAAFSYKVMAQEGTGSSDNKKQTEEIVIRKRGDKDANITVQITGDKVLINGKPLAEFKDEEITINKKKIMIRDGNRLMELGDLDNMSFNFNTDGFKGMMAPGMKQTFLGVNTEKADDGAIITEVTKGGAAEKSGLQKDDIITKVGDKKIDGPQILSEVISSMKPKEEVKVYYKRNGKDKSVKAILQERKNSGMKSFSYTTPEGGFKTFSMPKVPGSQSFPKIQGWNNVPGEGIDIENFNQDYFMRRQKLGLKIQDTDEGNGVKILDVEDSSAAAVAGLKKDDIITEIGTGKVTNTDEARMQLHENAEKASYTVKAKRNGSEMNFTIKIPKKLKTANL
ncbi:MAG: PDZ domain-containing protein [Ferruginibacter sp.]